jgi:hypothetical protein
MSTMMIICVYPDNLNENRGKRKEERGKRKEESEVGIPFPGLGGVLGGRWQDVIYDCPLCLMMCNDDYCL